MTRIEFPENMSIITVCISGGNGDRFITAPAPGHIHIWSVRMTQLSSICFWDMDEIKRYTTKYCIMDRRFYPGDVEEISHIVIISIWKKIGCQQWNICE